MTRARPTPRTRPASRALRLAALSLVLAVLAWLALAAAFYVKQDAWIHASPRDRAEGVAPGLAGRELRIPAGGAGEALAAWWVPAGRDAPSVLYLIGVGHALTDEAAAIATLHGMGASVLAVEYRGFGRSDGRYAGERTVHEDAEAAWRELTRLAPASPRRLVQGHSLGGAIAIELAARHPEIDGLVLESTFTTMADVLRQSRIMRLLPLGVVLEHRYASVHRIDTLRMPKLFVHGADDIFVPPWMSRALHERAAPPKALVVVPGAGHTGAFVASPAAREAVRGMLAGAPLPTSL